MRRVLRCFFLSSGRHREGERLLEISFMMHHPFSGGCHDTVFCSNSLLPTSKYVDLCRYAKRGAQPTHFSLPPCVIFPRSMRAFIRQTKPCRNIQPPSPIFEVSVVLLQPLRCIPHYYSLVGSAESPPAVFTFLVHFSRLNMPAGKS